MNGIKTGRPSKARPARADMVRLYVEEGLALRDVAAALGISKDLAARSLREFGIRRRANVKRSKLHARPLAELRAMIERDGFPAAAAALGVNVTTLRRFMASKKSEGGKRK